jgi:diguanylate cyclase (GGDEF)-like protein
VISSFFNNLALVEPSASTGEQSEKYTPLQQFAEATSDLFLLIDASGVLHFVNPSMEALFGVSRDDLQGCLVRDLFPELISTPIDDVSAGDRLQIALNNGTQHSLRLQATAPIPGGGWQWLLAEDSSGQRFREQLLRQREIVQLTLCSVGDAVITTTASGDIESINPMAREILQLSAANVINVPADEILILVDSVSHRPLTSLVQECMRRGQAVRTPEAALLYVAGRKPMRVFAQASPLRDSHNNLDGCLLVFRDISLVAQEAKKLHWHASHDVLTLLPNRQSFESEVAKAVESAKDGEVFGLLYVDLFQFKLINDTCGHAGGDELLRQLSELFSSKLRGQDILARLGSDEFGVLLKNCTMAGTQRVADILLRAVQNFKFQWESRDIKIGISVGAVTIDHAAETEAQVLANANAACCMAKEAGRNRIHLYHHNKEIDRRRSEIGWVVKINEALSQDRLRLYRQAVIPLQENSGEVPHYEVLLRMEDEQGKIVGPGEFIPAAERYGLMDEVDRWVVTKVIAHLQERKHRGLAAQRYAVNLSGVSVGDDTFARFVLEQLAQHDIDPSLLHFELTETAAIRHLDCAIGFIEQLREKGCQFYLDDFGSGLSSFGYLKDLPVDYLKIDGSFVSAMADDSASYAMVSTINHLAHVMGLKTVAEYVENHELRQQLQELGVDFGQGFGLAVPEPVVLD